MKFISWILNIQRRYNGQGLRYRKGGIAHRVLSMVCIFALTAVAIVLEYFALKTVLTDGNLLGIFLIVIAFACIVSSIELNIVYAYFGFKTYKTGSIEGFLEKAKRKNQENTEQENAEIDDSQIETNAQSIQQPDENQQQGETIKRKCPRGLDLFAGIFFLVLAIAEVAMVVVVFGLI